MGNGEEHRKKYGREEKMKAYTIRTYILLKHSTRFIINNKIFF